VVGRDNLRASVTADIDFSQTEQTAEAYRPTRATDAKAAIRASSTEDANQPGRPRRRGVPGATSNQPPVPATAPVNGQAQPLQGAQGGTAAGNSAARSRPTTRSTRPRVTRNATGNVRRLNAAVVVNHRGGTDKKGKTTSTPLSEKEVES
jgi:flagellar M-ring protein FliF